MEAATAMLRRSILYIPASFGVNKSCIVRRRMLQTFDLLLGPLRSDWWLEIVSTFLVRWSCPPRENSRISY